MEKKVKFPFLLALLGVILAGCATVTIPSYKTSLQNADAADRLDAYYKSRVRPLGWGNFKINDHVYPAESLPAYFRSAGDGQAAIWVERGRWWSLGCWGFLVLSEAYFARESRDPSNSLGAPTWAVALGPLALITWGLQYLGGVTYTDPAATHFNKFIRDKLDLGPGTKLEK